MSDAQHTRFSPSASHRWLKCPGSLVLHRGIGTSDAATEGTTAHFLASSCLDMNLDPLQAGNRLAALKLEQIPDGVDLSLIDTDMCMHIQGYVDFVRAQVPEGGELFVEQFVSFRETFGLTEQAGGTADAVIVTPAMAIVIDLKYGRSPYGRVDAEDNTQLMLYDLGVAESFSHYADFTTFRNIIYQPRLDHIDIAEVSIGDLTAFKQEAQGVITDVQAYAEHRPRNAQELMELDDLVPGETQCRWCSAKPTCPALAKWVNVQTTFDFEDLPDEVAPIPPDTNVLSRAMNAVSLIEHWCKAVRAETERALLDGETIDGWKLVQGRKGARQWSDADAVEALFKTKFRLKVDQMYDFKLISPPKAEKLLGEKPRQWKQVEALIAQAEGGLSVAPEKDKRPAVNPLTLKGSADDFADLDAVDDLM